MDGISGAAAVIGLVQAATQVTTALGRYVSRIKQAESSRAKLLDQLALISNAETAISSIVQNSPQSVHTGELQVLIDKWFKDDGPPRRCKRDLDALAGWLEKEAETNKRSRLAQKMSWPFKEDKIQATIRVFEGYMPYFRDILSIKTFNLVESLVTSFKSSELVTAKSELLSWLDGFDCTNKYESTLRQRQQTTGDWLLKEELYIDWRNGSRKFIWLHGKPGAGKSVLASAVIDDLLNGLADNETLAYFYCDFRNIRCTRAMEVLRSVAKQLLWNSKRDWLSSFSDLTARKERGAGPPTDLGTLSDLLHRAAELHERPIIVIDALDECEDLSDLLDELTKWAHGRCILFVTSRTLHSIKETFKDISAIPLDDRVDEMRSDMHLHIKTELESRSRLKSLKQDLKDEIGGALMKKADGMFRWVQCQLDRLGDCYSLGDVRMVLDTLPETLYETYDQMLRAIDRKPLAASRARRALRWLVTALQPLELSQLAEAMSITCDKPAWDFVDAPMHETVILEILGSLVTTGEYGTITLSHYSVKEYLTSDTLVHTGSPYFVDRPNASLELATLSIFSLMLFSHKSETKKFRLCSYADSCGLRHLADCHLDHNDLLVGRLLTFQNHTSTHRLIYERRRWSNPWMFTSPRLALYIIIRFGHPTLLGHYLDHYPVRATEGDNPLVFAALYSDTPRVQILLGKHIDANLEGAIHTDVCVRKMAPLAAAARNERKECQDELVKLLIENGCLVSKDAIHRIFVCDLGVPCKPAVVRILLEHGADPQFLDAEKRSCLHVFLESLRESSPDDEFEIVRILVDAGCDPMTPDIEDITSFHLVIRQLPLEFVQWLVQRGFRLPSDALLHAVSRRSRPLRIFASWLFPDDTKELLCMLQFLVRNGADVGAQDAHGCNALHLFSMRGFLFNESIKSILLLLVEHGCGINCKNDAGETPLHLAATSSTFNADILELFLAQGAKLPVDIINYATVQPQDHWLLRRKRNTVTILTLLVEKFGASCQSKTINGDNAMHCLLKDNPVRFPTKDISEVVSFLMENGCDVHAPASSGETPLQLAIENGCFSVAQSILTRITKLYSVDRTIPNHGDLQGNGILHRLCHRRDGQFEDKVKRLREAGYDFARDINRPNKKGMTPLCITLKLSKAADGPTTIPCLLQLGASFYYVNYLHMEWVEWASNLPWYHDATEVHERYLTRSKTTPEDVIRVYQLLRLAHQGRLPSAVARSILDTAEYWACMKVTRKNVQYTGGVGNDSEPISFPMVPGNAGRWIPRRLIFACKGVFSILHRSNHASIRVRVGRQTGCVFTVPVSLRVFHDAHEPPTVSFDVWDEFTPAEQVGGKQRLMVEELASGDTLNMEFCYTDNDFVTLEFFHVDVYYAMKPGYLTNE